MKSLAKKEREKIFSLFLRQEKLRFNEIEKAINIRSNKLAYHLEQLIKEELLTKKGEFYVVTDKAESYLPIIPHLVGDSLSPLPVILVALVNEKNQVLLMKRNLRPYKNYWSLIGGKMLLSENFQEASIRLIREKTGIKGSFSSINSVLHEQVKNEKKVKYSFILFFTKVTCTQDTFQSSPYGNLQWFDVDTILYEKIIPSDKWLIMHKLKTTIEVKSATMQEENEEVSKFQINN